MIKWSVLDQSPISEGSNAVTALANTAKLARKVEELGYHRFWVSEHHYATTLAGSSPEVLISHLAGQTSTIRVGSGGVMLSGIAAMNGYLQNFKPSVLGGKPQPEGLPLH